MVAVAERAIQPILPSSSKPDLVLLPSPPPLSLPQQKFLAMYTNRVDARAAQVHGPIPAQAVTRIQEAHKLSLLWEENGQKKSFSLINDTQIQGRVDGKSVGEINMVRPHPKLFEKVFDIVLATVNH